MIIGLGLHSEVRRALLDLISLLRLLSSRPTHVRELVPDMPMYAGYHDAAAEGAGGVWFSLVDDNLQLYGGRFSQQTLRRRWSPKTPRTVV